MKYLRMLRLGLITAFLGTALTATAIAGQVIPAKSVEYADVAAAVEQAADGDTVEVPAGTAVWSQDLIITKGITLAGKTTTRGAGTKNATADDQTIIIVDGGPKSENLLTFNTSKPFRLTGFTIRPGAKEIPDQSLAQSVIGLNGRQGTAFRMDNMHLDGFKRRAVWSGGWLIGVIDSTIIRNKRSKRHHHSSFRFDQHQWNGHGDGHGAWADYPWLGTDKFVFVEDTTIFGSLEEGGSGNVDASAGARFVIRHNYFSQATVASHGTADNSTGRGTRCAEIYDNVFDWDGRAPHDFRTGTLIWHDNAWPTKMGPDTDYFVTLPVFRVFNRAYSWGFAQGTNPWDQNDTEGDGTFVEGHPPKTFEAGTATGDSVRSNKGVTFEDKSKHWKPGQWKGYSITNVDSPEKYFGIWIVDNTENTITHMPGQGLKFAVGEKYEIHRVVRALDQHGVGKGDLLKSAGNHVINTVTGTISYPHQQQETCYEWNNTHTPTGKPLRFDGGRNCSTKEGRDYINLGNGRPADVIPDEVQKFYTAKVNGVDYVGEFTYPHPLRGGGTPTP